MNLLNEKANQHLKTVSILLFMTVFISACRRESDLIPTLQCNDINTETTWEDRGEGVDYIIDCVISVNAKLTIKPGVNIRFGSNAGIVIETGGSLIAAGTPGNNIVMKSEEDIAGVWKGIYIKSSNVLNEITYCTISNGGNSSFDGNTTKRANIRLANGAKLKLQNTDVSKSANIGLLTDGLDSDDVNPLTSFANNSFKDNASFPISTTAAAVNSLDGTGSTYTGNTKQLIEIRGGRMYGNHTWNKCSIPYYINGYTIAGYYSDQGNLEVKQGVNIVFAADQGMGVGEYSNGYVKFSGSVTEPISLTGESTGQGTWKGVVFQSMNAQNKMDNVVISGGGSSSFTGATALKANISVGGYSAGVVRITNTAVNNSGGYGILVRMGSTEPTGMTNVTYSNNALNNYEVQ